ncbi:MAG: hypothetical protein L0Z70_11800 [Chloroflexi bacterium]|nr:hypothetical protein [Chloroflexota bacterium]
MRCNRCGGELALDEQFCGECGAARPRLTAEFENVRTRFLALQARFQAGELSEAQYQSALEKLVLQDAGGSYWMIGAESGQWYLYDGKAWTRADPPGLPAAPPRPAGDAPPARQAAQPTPPAIASKANRSPRSCLLLAGLALLLLCLLTALIYFFRQPLLDRFVSLAVERGWGTVVEEESAAQPLPPPAGWQALDLAEVGVRLYVPPDAEVEISPEIDYGNVDIAEPSMLIDIMWQSVEPGVSLSGVIEYWLAFQRNFTWDAPLYRQSGVGEYAWAKGVSERPWPVWTAVYYLPQAKHRLMLITSLPENASEADFALLLQISDSAQPIP